MELGGIRAPRPANTRKQLVEKAGHVFLLRDARFQRVDVACKRRILELLAVDPDERYGPRSFDLVMTDEPTKPITLASVDALIDRITLVELKTTNDAIEDGRLDGFFYGATENEYRLATRLGRRYLFAFVVLNPANAYGSPFAVLRSIEEIEAQTKNKRTQFQVMLRAAVEPPSPGQLVLVEVVTQSVSSPS